MNLTPFTWPVPSGFKVVTREGEEVTQLTKFEVESNLPIRGVLSGYIESWRIDGKFQVNGHESGYDLFLAPIEKEVWVVIKELDGELEIFLTKNEKFTETIKGVQLMKHPNAEVSIHKIILP